jgi:hypothetical protein
MDLGHVVPARQLQAATARGFYTCYIMGDVGGIEDPEPQRRVAAALCALTGDAARYDVGHAPSGDTLFTYLVGDVVYNHGVRPQYLLQFYEPYRQYQRPILAIPGNHDGDPDLSSTESLDGFIANFCAPYQGPAEDAGALDRLAIDQPNVYWTLEAPWLRIVGLYSNVPEGGYLDEEQHRWFLEQMVRPRDGKHLVVALHQPVFSADSVHGGSEPMFELIHEPARRAGCKLVIAGHVHNYQRFTYDSITYVVAGAGGYYGLHGILPPEFPGAMYPVVAHTYDHSFVHMTVTPDRLTLRAIAVPAGFNPHADEPRRVDRFSIGP